MPEIEFKNFKDFKKGYGQISDYIRNELTRIQKNEPKKDETEKERNEFLDELAAGLVFGAAKFQIVTNKTFYVENDDLEINDPLEKYYIDIPLDNKPNHLINEVITVLEVIKNV